MEPHLIRTKAARHTTRMVRDTKTLIITLKIQLSVTAPYSINVPVAAIPTNFKKSIFI
ncbi:hypothetical protein Riv7116_4704 [Rivularia sp. PCC 7116]|nr:hypothetical protein Riv7116_4704 [Rivularia sp. PCC 7116]